MAEAAHALIIFSTHSHNEIHSHNGIRSLCFSSMLPSCRTYNDLLVSEEKEYCMSNLQETNRVLGRAGARLLSDEEIQQIAGGFNIGRSFGSGLGTGACQYDPVTCRVISGDCSDVPPPCLGQ
jgi:hypothetical protein